jgi:hypothetical protein
MRYAVEMASGAKIHIPSFIKICSAIQKLMGGGVFTDTQIHRTHRQRQHGDRIMVFQLINNIVFQTFSGQWQFCKFQCMLKWCNTTLHV